MPAALEGIDWDQAKLDFVRLRSEGIGYYDSLTEISDRYGVKLSTVEYHSKKDAWVATVDATKGKVSAIFTAKLEEVTETIAKNVGQQMLDQLKEFTRVPAKKPMDLVAKANALKTLSEVRSRYNPDGQEKAGGLSLFQVNVGSDMRQPAIEAQVTDVKTVKSE